jgi:multidrug efflux pump subunit AcrA (membrane-fusion protein)
MRLSAFVEWRLIVKVPSCRPTLHSALRWSVLLLVLPAGAGCGEKAAPPTDTTEAKPSAAPVTVVKPQRKTVRRAVSQPGHIEAFEQTAIYVKVPGYVRNVQVDIGDPLRAPRFDEKGEQVEAGTVLAELRVPEMEVELKQKEALVRQADALVTQAREAVSAAAANFESAKAKVNEAEAGRSRAQAELNRTRTQHEMLTRAGKNGTLNKDSVAEAQFAYEAAAAGVVEVEAKVKSAEAARDESKARLDKARADVTVAESGLEVGRENRDYVKTLLAYTRIEAPYSGVVVKRNVNTGDLVQPAAAGNKGEPLFVVARIDPVRVFVEVPETDAVLVRNGARAAVRVRGLNGEEFTGTVVRSSWAVDPKARTLRAEIDVPNPQGTLRPGMYAQAIIQVEHPDTWALPAAALLTQDEQTFCYRVEGGRAVRTPVRVGIHEGDVVEVLKKQTSPIKPGEEGVWEDFTGAEEVIRGNLASIKDGQSIPRPGDDPSP